MGPSSTFGIERIFNSIRWVLAYCGGKVLVQNDEFCDGEKNLTSVYLDPSHPASFSGVGAVYRTIKEREETDISPEDVNLGYTLYKSTRRPYKRSRVIVHAKKWMLTNNNLDTFLERYSMNFIAFYCKLNIKKEENK